MRVWMCREFNQYGAEDACYVIHFGKQPQRCENFDGLEFWTSGEIELCPDSFHRAVKGFRLKPGGGPVQVEIAIKPVKKRKKK